MSIAELSKENGDEEEELQMLSGEIRRDKNKVRKFFRILLKKKFMKNGNYI